MWTNYNIGCNTLLKLLSHVDPFQIFVLTRSQHGSLRWGRLQGLAMFWQKRLIDWMARMSYVICFNTLSHRKDHMFQHPLKCVNHATVVKSRFYHFFFLSSSSMGWMRTPPTLSSPMPSPSKHFVAMLHWSNTWIIWSSICNWLILKVWHRCGHLQHWQGLCLCHFRQQGGCFHGENLCFFIL